MTNGRVPKWRKVLYEDSQGFEDNFTPTGSFLAAIEKNKGVRVYTRRECLAGAGRVGNEVRVNLAIMCAIWQIWLYQFVYKGSFLYLAGLLCAGVLECPPTAPEEAPPSLFSGRVFFTRMLFVTL